MTETMLDAAYEPLTITGFDQLKAATSATIFAAYVPGWGTPYHATSVAEVQEAASQGFSILPIIVPSGADVIGNRLTEQDYRVGIQMALNFMHAAGLSATSPAVACDYEAGYWSQNRVNTCNSQIGFISAGRSMNVRAIPYWSPSNANDYASRGLMSPEAIWVASWVMPAPTQLANIVGLDSHYFTSGERGWQYAGGTNIAGYNVDRSLTNFTGLFAAPQPAPAPPVATIPAPLSQAEIELQSGNISSAIQSIIDYLRGLMA